MIFDGVPMNTKTQEAINAIVEVATEEEKELLAIKRSEDLIISFKDQLIARFRDKYGMYDKRETMVRAAEIFQNNILNFEKLKQEKEIIAVLKDPTNFYKISEQNTDSDKKTGVRGSTDTASESTNFDQTKGRGGSANNYKEYDLIGQWDDADKQTLDAVRGQSDRSDLAQDWLKVETGEEKTSWEMTPVNPRKPDKPIPGLEIKEASNDPIPLSTLEMSVTRGLSINKSNANTNTGRAIDSLKNVEQVTKSYVKAQAIQDLQKLQHLNIRARIINDFACLFSGAWGACQ